MRKINKNMKYKGLQVTSKLVAFCLLFASILLYSGLDQKTIKLIGLDTYEGLSLNNFISSPKVLADTTKEEVLMPQISDIRADSYILIDAFSGHTILEYRSELPVYPASLTKILTAAVALEKVKDNDIITTSQYAGSLSRNESKIDLLPGEKMTFKDMLFGMMIASGNDASIAIAEHISGNIGAFATLMNAKSIELETKNSRWLNPSGINEDGHVTTSSDLAKITKYALEFPLFREAVSTDIYSLSTTNKHPYTDWNVLENTNKLMKLQDSHFNLSGFKGIYGVKTGTTPAAGSNLITYAVANNGLGLICVINGVRDDDSKYIWHYTAALLEHGAGLNSASSDSFHQILSPNTPVELEQEGSVQKFCPEFPFAYYGELKTNDFEYKFNLKDKVLRLIYDGKEVFSTKFSLNEPYKQTDTDSSGNPSIKDKDNEESYSGATSVTGKEDPNSGKSEMDKEQSNKIWVALLWILGLLLYTLVIWSFARSFYRKRRKGRRV